MCCVNRCSTDLPISAPIERVLRSWGRRYGSVVITVVFSNRPYGAKDMVWLSSLTRILQPEGFISVLIVD